LEASSLVVETLENVVGYDPEGEANAEPE